MSDLSTRVRLRREQLGLSQEELARRMGYRSRSSITKLEKGINDLPQSKVEELAQALETTPAALLGLDAPCACPPGFEPLPTMVQVPLIGSIACGTPITAEQNIECYIGVPAAWHADFALTCHGDSMSPTICNGDIVCIRCQPEVEQGEIAAVRVGEEATLKHFHRQGDAVMNQLVCFVANQWKKHYDRPAERVVCRLTDTLFAIGCADKNCAELAEELNGIYAEMPRACVASVGLMRRVPFTQSIGVAGTREVRCKNWDALYDLCEKRLAAAQAAGGDRIYDGE